MPRPVEALPCGSRSTTSVRQSELGQAGPGVDRRGGLADATLLVGDSDHAGEWAHGWAVVSGWIHRGHSGRSETQMRGPSTRTWSGRPDVSRETIRGPEPGLGGGIAATPNVPRETISEPRRTVTQVLAVRCRKIRTAPRRRPERSSSASRSGDQRSPSGGSLITILPCGASTAAAARSVNSGGPNPRAITTSKRLADPELDRSDQLGDIGAHHRQCAVVEVRSPLAAGSRCASDGDRATRRPGRGGRRRRTRPGSPPPLPRSSTLAGAARSSIAADESRSNARPPVRSARPEKAETLRRAQRFEREPDS